MASVVMLLTLGAGFTFIGDEWELVLHRRGMSADAFLTPLNEHLVLVPSAVYKLALALFGIESTLPLQIVAALVLLMVAALLFAHLRHCVGAWPALVASALVLFLGAAWEVLLWPINIGFSGAMAAGLAMLLALKRSGARSDPCACVLLAVSIACTSLGLVFALGAAAEIVLRGERRLARSYVVLLPVLLYGAWYVAWGDSAASATSLENLAGAPRFIAEGIGSSLAALLGLFALKGEVTETARLAGALVVVLAGAALLVSLTRARRLRAAFVRRSRWLWVALVLLFGFWWLAALNEVPGRTPSASRYMYPGAIFVLLLLAESLRGVRIGRRTGRALVIVACVALAGNLVALAQGQRLLERESTLTRAELGALELARDSVDPSYRPVSVVGGSQRLWAVDAGSYLSAVEVFGSPADDPEQLRERSESVRAVVDRVLAQALEVDLEVGAGEGWTIAPHTHRGRAVPTPGDPCVPIREAGPAAYQAWVLRDPILVRASDDAGAQLGLRRFAAETFPVQLPVLPAGRPARLELPRDRSSEPWELALAPGDEIEACVQAE